MRIPTRIPTLIPIRNRNRMPVQRPGTTSNFRKSPMEAAIREDTTVTREDTVVTKEDTEATKEDTVATEDAVVPVID